MRIIIDSREQLPWRFAAYDVELEVEALPAGDYSLPGYQDRVAIERKSLDDLVGCLVGEQRARFQRELQRLRSYDLSVVIIEAGLSEMRAGQYRSRMAPHAAVQSVVAFQVRYRVPFIWAGSRAGGEYLAQSLLLKYLREAEVRYREASRSQLGGKISPK